MAETLEAFIHRLQEDGVKAGQEAAEKIRSEAEQQAGRILEEARSQAETILQQARTESEQIRSRAETELKLAIRDAVNRLQETFGRVLRALLQEAARRALSDPELIKELMRLIVSQYVASDLAGKECLTFNVSPEMREKLVHWVIEEFHKGLEGESCPVDLQGTLHGAGIEYKIVGGTVEITEASAVELLSELVGPELQKLISRAAKET